MVTLPRTVDRSLARLIATKRVITGSLGIACGVGFVAFAVMRGAEPSPAIGLALLLFFGGGAWTLRDGLRLRRELSRS